MGEKRGRESVGEEEGGGLCVLYLDADCAFTSFSSLFYKSAATSKTGRKQTSFLILFLTWS